jgi:hypothetical protein
MSDHGTGRLRQPVVGYFRCRYVAIDRIFAIGRLFIAIGGIVNSNLLQ